MTSQNATQQRVLGLSPCANGIGFAYFDGSQTLLDWGVRYVNKDKNRVGIKKVEDLLATLKPDVLLIENHHGTGSRRRRRVRSLIRMIARWGEASNISVKRYSRGDMRECFKPFGTSTKHEIARQIATWFPELKPHLPTKRRPWLPEHPKMALFDAVALVLTYYDRDGR